MQLDKNQKDLGFKRFFKIKFDLTPLKNGMQIANDPLVNTEDLIFFATEAIRFERENPEDERYNYALLILQQRATPEVLDKVRELCRSPDAAERQLGTLILREFPGEPQGRPYTAEALEILGELISQEQDLSVLTYAVSAIGWQGTPQAIPLLLPFVAHPHAGVRFMVSNNLVLNCPEDNWFPPEIAAAYQKLCFDSNADVRWYAYANFADILEDGWPLPVSQRQDLEGILNQGLKDTDPQVVEQARKAWATLNSYQEFEGVWKQDST